MRSFPDPPRAGSSEAFLRAPIKTAPARVVYVSCDPGTLARDLRLFAAPGFSPAVGTAGDVFPHTAHVETVCLPAHKKSRDR